MDGQIDESIYKNGSRESSMNGAIDTIYGYPSQMRVSRSSNEIGLPKNLGRGSCVKTVHKSLKRVVSNFKEDQN